MYNMQKTIFNKNVKKTRKCVHSKIFGAKKFAYMKKKQ